MKSTGRYHLSQITSQIHTSESRTNHSIQDKPLHPGQTTPPRKTVMEVDDNTSRTINSRKCCRNGPGGWCKKYFWEGQDVSSGQAKALESLITGLPWHKAVLIKHRRIFGFLIPAAIIHFFWWPVAIKHDLWNLFPEKYAMSITMIFGSMIAGLTSEGGGAIAFPVMTLALGINPVIARDFALMIQSFGMTAAAFTIFFMRVRIEWHSLICNSIGGVGGMIFGLHMVDPYLTPHAKKLGFVSIWFAFALVLIILNRVVKRRTFKTIPNFNLWKMLILLLFGFIGGIFSAFSGSGVDRCSFMILTLLFRVSEKIAIPTSIILMGVNSCVGFIWRWLVMDEISQYAWKYLVVCIPIVVVGAPIGSVLSSHFHRLVLANMVVIIDSIAFIGAYATVRPSTTLLVSVCVAIIVGCFGMFMLLTFLGSKLLANYEKQEERERNIKASENFPPPTNIASVLNGPTFNGLTTDNLTNPTVGYYNEGFRKDQPPQTQFQSNNRQ